MRHLPVWSSLNQKRVGICDVRGIRVALMILHGEETEEGSALLQTIAVLPYGT